jgi:purine-binding chemotaxis protein CheW
VPSETAATQYLCVSISDDAFGLGLLEARGIIQYPQLTLVPSMPSAIRGVINLRGSVVPVVDLGVVFGRGLRPITKWTCVVVVVVELARDEPRPIGIVVDSVDQVIDVPDGEVEPPPAFGTWVHPQFLRGLGKAGASFVHLIDLPCVLEHVAHLCRGAEAA